MTSNTKAILDKLSRRTRALRRIIRMLDGMDRHAAEGLLNEVASYYLDPAERVPEPESSGSGF